MPEESLMGRFFLGISLGVLCIPCIGPILGAVLALVASVENTTYGAWMLFVYSVDRNKWFSRNGELLKKLSGLVLILIGIMLLFGVDKLFIKWPSPYFPTTFYGI